MPETRTSSMWLRANTKERLAVLIRRAAEDGYPDVGEIMRDYSGRMDSRKWMVEVSRTWQVETAAEAKNRQLREQKKAAVFPDKGWVYSELTNTVHEVKKVGKKRIKGMPRRILCNYAYVDGTRELDLQVGQVHDYTTARRICLEHAQQKAARASTSLQRAETRVEDLEHDLKLAREAYDLAQKDLEEASINLNQAKSLPLSP